MTGIINESAATTRTGPRRSQDSVVLTSEVLRRFAKADEDAAVFKKRYDEAYSNVFGTERVWRCDYGLTQTTTTTGERQRFREYDVFCWCRNPPLDLGLALGPPVVAST